MRAGHVPTASATASASVLFCASRSPCLVTVATLWTPVTVVHSCVNKMPPSLPIITHLPAACRWWLRCRCCWA